jgi:hypothetical protein
MQAVAKTVERPEPTSLFGRLPIEEEKEKVREILADITEAWVRVFVPTVVFDKEIVVEKLKNVKKKIGDIL